jgi:hypothetical protein
MKFAKTFAITLSALVPLFLVGAGCSDNTSTKGQLLTCTPGAAGLTCTPAAGDPAPGQCQDVDDDGDGEAHDDHGRDCDNDGMDNANDSDDDNDGTPDSADSDDDSDGVPDSMDCDKHSGEDDDSDHDGDDDHGGGGGSGSGSGSGSGGGNG